MEEIAQAGDRPGIRSIDPRKVRSLCIDAQDLLDEIKSAGDELASSEWLDTKCGAKFGSIRCFLDKGHEQKVHRGRDFRWT